MELPVLHAAFGPMRRGGICALEASDISGNMVKDGTGGWVIKTPKSYAGDRYIDYPDFVAEKWEGIPERIIRLTPNNITSQTGPGTV